MDSILMPSSEYIEKSVLGNFMLHREIYLKYSHLIIPEYFYKSSHKTVFEFMQRENITEYKLIREKYPHLESEFFTIIEEFQTSNEIEAEINILRDKYERRKLIEISYTAINQSANDFDLSSTQIIEETMAKINSSHFISGKPEHIKTINERVINQLQANLTGTPLGYHTGLKEVDEILGGFMPSELAIIAARPSMGKTSLINHIIRFQAISCRNSVLFYSLEMGKDQIAGRILFSESNASYGNALKGNKKELLKISENIVRVNNSEIWIDDTPGTTVNNIYTKTESLVKQKGIKMIFVDHRGFIAPTKRGRSTHEEISEISKALVAIAKKFNIPVILVSQLSREVEKRSPPIPQLSDLRESGSLEEDARKVVFLYRDEYYKKDASDKKGIASIIVAKNHHGGTGFIDVKFNANEMTFFDLDKNHEQGGNWNDAY